MLFSSFGPDYYAAFYLAGFGVAGGLLLRTGLQRDYPWQSWLLLMAGVLLLLILGTQLVVGSGAEWQLLLTHGHWPGHGGRSVLGGLVGAVVGLALLRRWLGLGRDVYDAFALPLVLGLAVQGFGCLLTGCCFGTPTEAGPGICYAAGTLPFLAHTEAGLLAPTAHYSLPVHPAQLYQIGLCLAIAGLLGRCRRQPWPAGSRFWLVLALYAAGRFALEFIRDAAGDLLGGGYWLGLKPVQWALLVATLSLLGLLRARSRSARQPASRPVLPVSCSASRRWVVVLMLLALTAVSGPGPLAQAELWIIRSLLVVVVAGIVLGELGQLRGRLGVALGLPLTLGVLAAGSMGQIPAPPGSSRPDTARRYTTLSAGGMVGRSDQYFDYPYGCSGSGLPGSTYRQRFQVASLGVARTLPFGQRGTFTMELAAAVGSSRFRPNQDPVFSVGSGFNPEPFRKGKARLYAVSPYLELSDARYYRLGVGVHFGNVAYDYAYEPGLLSTSRGQVVLEGGPLKIIYVHTGANYGLLGLGNGLATFGVGSGFGGTRLRLLGGVALANSEYYGTKLFDRTDAVLFPFLEGTVAAGPGWRAQVFAATNFGSIYQFRIQTQYRLPSRR